MKRVSLAIIAILAVAGTAAAGNKNTNSAEAYSSSNAQNNSSISNDIKQRLQPGTPGSFGGGGPCPQYFGLGVPGGSIAFGDTCKEGKQRMKASTVDTYFGRKATRDYLCATDKDLYGLDECVERRVNKSGVRQRSDRARYK